MYHPSVKVVIELFLVLIPGFLLTYPHHSHVALKVTLCSHEAQEDAETAPIISLTPFPADLQAEPPCQPPLSGRKNYRILLISMYSGVSPVYGSKL